MKSIRTLLMIGVTFFSSMIMASTVVITGAFDGIGKETAFAFAKKGYTVWATDKTIDNQTFKDYPNIHVLKLDVANDKDIHKAAKKILGKNPQIDVLVNNAGYGLIGASESISTAEIQQLYQVNLFGLLSVTQAFLPAMREQKQGHIINISSTSAIRALPGLGVYASTKWALEGLSEGLAAELTPWNIRVSLVEPQTVATRWVENAKMAQNHKTPEYENLALNLKKTLEERLHQGQAPQEVANIVVALADSSSSPFRTQTIQGAQDLANKRWTDPTGDQILVQQVEFAQKLYQKIEG